MGVVGAERVREVEEAYMLNLITALQGPSTDMLCRYVVIKGVAVRLLPLGLAAPAPAARQRRE